MIANDLGNGGVLNKVMTSIFGNNSIDLSNEPTIDYNHTIPSFDDEVYRKQDHHLISNNQSTETTMPTRDSSRQYPYRQNETRETPRNDYSMSRDKNLFHRGYNDLFGDVKDDQFDYDYSQIQGRVSRQIPPKYNGQYSKFRSMNSPSDKRRTNYSLYDNHTENYRYNNHRIENPESIDNTTSSLPANYPGKFPKDSTTDEKIRQLERELLVETDLNTNYNKNIRSWTPSKKYEEIVTADGNATKNLRTILGQIEKQNQFLSSLNDLVDVNLDVMSKKEISKPQQIKSKNEVNYEEEYKKLRKEYIEELSNHQLFYKSYQRLMIKYKELKAKISSSDSDPNKKLKDKVKLIKSTTTQSSIRSMCDNILLEVNENDLLLNSYKLELEAANLKIKQLESKSK